MRNGCQTVIQVIKVNPQKDSVGFKSVVNMITIESEHFGVQALGIKRAYMEYLPRVIAVDGNGLGKGLMDFLTVPTEDKVTGDVLPAFGVVNDDKRQYKNIDHGGNIIRDVIHVIIPNSEINSVGYTNIVSQMGSGKVKFLIEERIAKNKMLATKRGQQLSPDERVDELRPFVLTTVLKEELMNLKEGQTDSNSFKLIRINKNIPHDKVSALMYGLYVIKEIEDSERKRKRGSISDMMMFG